MPLHHRARRPGISRADRAINLPMQIRRLLQIPRALRRLAPFVVESRRDGLHQRGENRIPRRLRDDAMKAHVMDQILDGVADRRVHLRDLLRHGREVLLAPALRRQRRQLAFEDAAGLEHLPRLKSMERAQQTQRRLAQLWRPVRHKRAHAMAHIHHAHRRQVSDAGPQAGAADAQPPRKLPLRRNSVARLQVSGFNHGSDVVDHPHRHVCVGFRHCLSALQANLRP